MPTITDMQIVKVAGYSIVVPFLVQSLQYCDG